MPHTDAHSSAPGTPEDWLARAKSNLALAKAPKPKDSFWEDLCYNAQQAAEKALKAVIQHHQMKFRYVHDLEELITLLEIEGVDLPDEVREAAVLTSFAVGMRYPGTYEPVTEEEYREAVRIAESVVNWAEQVLVAK